MAAKRKSSPKKAVTATELRRLERQKKEALREIEQGRLAKEHVKEHKKLLKQLQAERKTITNEKKAVTLEKRLLQKTKRDIITLQEELHAQGSALKRQERAHEKRATRTNKKHNSREKELTILHQHITARHERLKTLETKENKAALLRALRADISREQERLHALHATIKTRLDRYTAKRKTHHDKIKDTHHTTKTFLRKAQRLIKQDSKALQRKEAELNRAVRAHEHNIKHFQKQALNLRQEQRSLNTTQSHIDALKHYKAQRAQEQAAPAHRAALETHEEKRKGDVPSTHALHHHANSIATLISAGQHTKAAQELKRLHASITVLPQSTGKKQLHWQAKHLEHSLTLARLN